MSQQYLLPCSCGKSVRVDAAQAGGSVACVCGKNLFVPTFRGLKQLELAPHDAALERTAPQRNWSQLHGAAFSLGLLAAFLSLIVGGLAVLQYLQIAAYTVDQTSAIVQEDAKHLELISADHSLELFRHWQTEGLGEQVAPDWVHAQKFADAMRQRIIICGIVGGIGLLAAIGAVAIRRRAK